MPTYHLVFNLLPICEFIDSVTAELYTSSYYKLPKKGKKMKNLVIQLVLIALTLPAFAATEMSCVVREFHEGQATEQTLLVPITENSHGTIQFFNLSVIKELTGFVATMGEYAVINVIHENGMATSSMGHLKDQKGIIAQHQVILPAPGLYPRGIMVVCQISQ